MASDIHLSVSTAYGDGFESYVDYVKLPTGFGSLGILRGHCDMLCAVSAGTVCYTADGEQRQYSGGRRRCNCLGQQSHPAGFQH